LLHNLRVLANLAMVFIKALKMKSQTRLIL